MSKLQLQYHLQHQQAAVAAAALSHMTGLPFIPSSLASHLPADSISVSCPNMPTNTGIFNAVNKSMANSSVNLSLSMAHQEAQLAAAAAAAAASGHSLPHSMGLGSIGTASAHSLLGMSSTSSGLLAPNMLTTSSRIKAGRSPTPSQVDNGDSNESLTINEKDAFTAWPGWMYCRGYPDPASGKQRVFSNII